MVVIQLHGKNERAWFVLSIFFLLSSKILAQSVSISTELVLTRTCPDWFLVRRHDAVKDQQITLKFTTIQSVFVFVFLSKFAVNTWIQIFAQGR